MLLELPGRDEGRVHPGLYSAGPPGQLLGQGDPPPLGLPSLLNPEEGRLASLPLLVEHAEMVDRQEVSPDLGTNMKLAGWVEISAA